MHFNCKFWKKSSSHDQPFRRIYKGDVPFLKDFEQEHIPHKPKKNLSPKVTRNFSEGDDDFRPKPVHRHSVTRNEIPTLPKKEAANVIIPEHYPSNFIVTSRYTVWNFMPKNLFEQFRRIVNFYFLVTAFIQTIIDSPVHPVTAVSPLAFVICVTAIKQGYEDWLRHKNDDMVNNRPVKFVKNGKIEVGKAKDICVGDIIKLEANEQVPSDLLLLGSSDDFMRCQLNTANLDGETTLKLRYCPSGLPYFNKPEDFNNLHVILECELPCEDLYEFSGALLIPAEKLSDMHWSPLESMAHIGEPSTSKKAVPKQDYIESLKSHGLVRQGMTDFISIPLSMENLVLRGTRLKNTDFIYGLVVYTGVDTRLARNSEKTQAKFSTVESAVNKYLIFFIGMLIIMVIFCSVMHYTIDWFPVVEGDPWYIEDHDSDDVDVLGVFQTTSSYVILFNYIIPISLYVTIELQKFLGSKFFVWDNEMVDEEAREPLCNTSDLNEELGQIEYLFSDKTGTLTQNLMQFRHCSVDAVRFEYKSDDRLYLVGSGSKENVESQQVDVQEDKAVLDFLRTLALCHSVQVVPKRKFSLDMSPKSTSLPELKSLIEGKHGKKDATNNPRLAMSEPESSQIDSQSKPGTVEYQASSPDEKALLESCEKLGVVYVGEKEDVMTLNIAGEVEKFKRLMHLEFDADRKCMSVIVESKGEMWLLTKGAESSIIPKCSEGPNQDTLKHVMEFALMGLRTLVVAKRKLTQGEYAKFIAELRAARRLIKDRQEKVREVYSSIESHMTLIGATGVEDQLQDHVPETLQAFAAAGIRVWMLTGDKLETGVNVAVSCGLITASTKQFILNRTTDPIQIKEKLEQFKRDIDPYDNTCLVIDGDSLGIAFKECPGILRDVSMAALRVVCCRMAPLQKAQVVQMVKHSPDKPTTCAVGDGANDCAMIQAAHVGIGILGKEGRQAARCADFALAKFGFMRKAILVHGHWYYVRLANLANYFFYKNIVFVFPQFFFCFQSNFSTQAIFNGLFLMFYNICFSACPIFYYGLTEQPYSQEELLKYPQLYMKNRKNALMSIRNFLPWLFSGVWHSVVCYYMTYFSWNNFDHMNDLACFGSIICVGVIIVVNIKIFLETKLISLWYIASHVYSYGTLLLITYVYSEMELEKIWYGLSATDFHNVFEMLTTSVNFWLLMPLIIMVSILPDMTVIAIRLMRKEELKVPMVSKKHEKIHFDLDVLHSYESLDKHD